MRPLILIFFASVCALHIQLSFADVEAELTSLLTAGTTSAVLKKINAQFQTKSEPKSDGKHFSALFSCSSVGSVTLKPGLSINSNLNQLKTCISKVSDKGLKSKLNMFYNAVNSFSSMIPKVNKAMADGKSCCQTYQTAQEKYLDSIKSNEAKLTQVLEKIGPFETKLLHFFVHVPNVANILRLSTENYLAEITAVITKINLLNNSKPKDQKTHIADLNALMDIFAKEDMKVIKVLNDDVTRISIEKCPNIKAFYTGL
ncbi:uncharacterized protein LOC116352433 [Contarinia nasturtii]|uniref:uncharacterized protein LOC116352433 n=1 Tax=Contarinia nasturtii TaxID=265458 RepID=UPI0012D41BC0|nr:uncharacterized protein LOC116352433 [Contarinia nasturtii]